MSRNPEKFISPEKPKKPGKLTPEEVKEMVKKYKKEHEGLLPEYFSLPGEEKEEEERELPEELLDYYEMKEQLKPIEQGLKNETLRKNMIEEILSDIQEGQEEGDIGSAWGAFHGYSFLLSYPEFNEIKKNYPEKINRIEEGLRNEILRKNMIKEILSDIQKGQEEGNLAAAWDAFRRYSFLLPYLSHLYQIGQKKLAEKESQKAMQPEKKKLPPIPEEKAF